MFILSSFFKKKHSYNMMLRKFMTLQIYYYSNSSNTETQCVGTLPKNEIVHEIDTEIHFQKHWDTQC